MMLAIVPARGGSKSIPGKNLRVVNGKPLLLWTLETLTRVPELTKIVVSTEDDEIAGVARTRGYTVLHRPACLAEDDVPLSMVAEHAARELRWNREVGVFQPTSPTLQLDTIREALWWWHNSDSVSACSVTPDTHLTWDEHGPLFETRVNRQLADPKWRETGGFHFARRVPVGDLDPLVGHPHLRIPVPEDQGVDIDTFDDLETARRILGRKHIEWRYTESPQIGAGHAYRTRALQAELAHHPAVDESADLVVFDKLDTHADEVLAVKAAGGLVVTLEDLGPGSAYADLVVNELYDDPRPGVLSGPRFAVLRPEFLALPEYEVRDSMNVMCCFGGTDPAHLTQRVAQVAHLEADVMIVRPGDGTHMAEAMREADLLITSAGRTAHEAAAVGVPTVTIAANEREARHAHCAGIVRLGHHACVSDEQIRGCVRRLLRSPEQREQMSRTARAQVDGLGARRIAVRIESLLEGL